MIYAGNMSESYAKHYKDRTYTHSTFIRGKEVRWYDVWTHEDESKPAFGENLNVTKTRQVDRIIRDNPPLDT